AAAPGQDSDRKQAPAHRTTKHDEGTGRVARTGSAGSARPPPPRLECDTWRRMSHLTRACRKGTVAFISPRRVRRALHGGHYTMAGRAPAEGRWRRVPRGNTRRMYMQAMNGKTRARLFGCCMALALALTALTFAPAANAAETTTLLSLGDSISFGYSQQKFNENFPNESPSF